MTYGSLKFVNATPRNQEYGGFRSLVRERSSGFMYDFYLYGGKESNEVIFYSNLQKGAQVFTKLFVELPRHIEHKDFF